MHLTDLYRNWLTCRDLGPAEIDRALTVALDNTSTELLETILRHQNCNDAHRARMRTSEDPKVIRSWIVTGRPTEADMVTFVDASSNEFLAGVLDGLATNNLSFATMERMWSRDDFAVRIGLLKYRRNGVPATWETWLLEARPFTGHAADERHVFTKILGSAPDTMWSIAAHSGDWDLMTWTLPMLPKLTTGNLTSFEVPAFINQVDAALDAEPAPGELDSIAAVVIAMVIRFEESGTTLVGTRLAEVGRRVLAKVVTDTATTRHLHDRLPAPEEDPAPVDHDELIAEVAAGVISEVTLDHAALVFDKKNSALWRAAATSPALTPTSAAALLPGTNATPELTIVMAGRDDTWLAELAILLWDDKLAPRHSYVMIYHRVASTMQDSMNARVLAARTDRIELLAQWGLASDDSISQIHASVLGDMKPAVTACVVDLTTRRLGTDPRTWALFESLVGDFEGTLGELFDTVDRLLETTAA